MAERLPLIKSSDRLALVGSTGTGKSTWARRKLEPIERLVVLDPQGWMDLKEWDLEPWRKGYKELIKPKGHARLYIPPLHTRAAWDACFQSLFTYRNILVYIDELYAVGPDMGSVGLRQLYTMGRKWGIGIWAATQRPKRIPAFAFSEAQWLCCFKLNRLADRRFVAEEMGDVGEKYLQPPLRSYEYVIYNSSMGRAQRMDPLPL